MLRILSIVIILTACSSRTLPTNSTELNLAPDYSDPMLPIESYEKIKNNPTSIIGTAMNFESAIIISGVYNRVELVEYEDLLIKKIFPNIKFNVIKDEVVEYKNKYYNVLEVECPTELNIKKLYFDVTELENNL